MNSLIQVSRQVQPLFIALLFASVGIAPSARAFRPEPIEDEPFENMAAEDDTAADAASGNEEGATGQVANDSNKRVIRMNITKPLQCAGGNVILKGNLVVTFAHPKVGVVKVRSVKEMQPPIKSSPRYQSTGNAPANAIPRPSAVVSY